MWAAGGPESGVAHAVAAGVLSPWVSPFSVPPGILLLAMFLGVPGAPSLPPKSNPAVQRLSLGIRRGRCRTVAVQLEPRAHCTVVWLVVAPCAHPESRCGSNCCKKEWDQSGSWFHKYRSNET